MMVILQRENLSWARGAIPVKASPPFVESKAGRYTHRVRSAAIHTSLGRPHMGVKCWCGMVILISKRKPNRMTNEPETGRPICATCEGRAIGAGQCGAREIAGREVMYQTRRGEVKP